MPADRPAPSECANCGEDIPRGARACPSCGADERTGWRDVDPADGLDLPEYGQPETSGDPRTVNGLAWYWWAVGAALVLLLGLMALRLR